MLISGIMPPIAVNESCMAMTAPQEAAVVITAKRADVAIPKRTSLPSMLPPESPRFASSGLPAAFASSARLLELAAQRSYERLEDGKIHVLMTLIDLGIGP